MKWCLFKIPYEKKHMGPEVELMIFVILLVAGVLLWKC